METTWAYRDVEYAEPLSKEKAREYRERKGKQMGRMMALNSEEIRNMFDHTTEGNE